MKTLNFVTTEKLSSPFQYQQMHSILQISKRTVSKTFQYTVAIASKKYRKLVLHTHSSLHKYIKMTCENIHLNLSVSKETSRCVKKYGRREKYVFWRPNVENQNQIAMALQLMSLAHPVKPELGVSESHSVALVHWQHTVSLVSVRRQADTKI